MQKNVNVTASAESTSKATESPIGTYNSPRTFGKAVNKVKRSLPNSPHKKTAVLKKLVSDVIGIESLVSSTRKVKHAHVTAENRALVVEFFCRDDISRQTPGIKDVKTIRKKGEQKQKLQKRFMVMTVGEARNLRKGFHM
uniref:Uncharacterized protein LOC114347894 n=1 Tax=Diabrotica virgifera virgifera TaxID=50390 RepID=A0A6P7GX89_DIAVI